MKSKPYIGSDRDEKLPDTGFLLITETIGTYTQRELGCEVRLTAPMPNHRAMSSGGDLTASACPEKVDTGFPKEDMRQQKESRAGPDSF